MVNFRVADFKMPEKTADFPVLNNASVSLHLKETIIQKSIHRLSVVDKFYVAAVGSVVPASLGQRWPKQLRGYPETIKRVESGRPGSAGFATTSGVCATSFPLRQTFSTWRNAQSSKAC